MRNLLLFAGIACITLSLGVAVSIGADHECVMYTTVCGGLDCSEVEGFCDLEVFYNRISQDELILGNCQAGSGGCNAFEYSCYVYKYDTDPMMPVCNESTLVCTDQATGVIGCQ